MGRRSNFPSEQVTTEFYKNGAWSNGPDLPKALVYSCATHINDTHVIITGSYWVYGCGNCSYIFDIVN